MCPMQHVVCGIRHLALSTATNQVENFNILRHELDKVSARVEDMAAKASSSMSCARHVRDVYMLPHYMWPRQVHAVDIMQV